MVVPFPVGVFWYDRSRVYAGNDRHRRLAVRTGIALAAEPGPVRGRGCSGRAFDRPAGDFSMGTESALRAQGQGVPDAVKRGGSMAAIELLDHRLVCGKPRPQNRARHRYLIEQSGPAIAPDS